MGSVKLNGCSSKMHVCRSMITVCMESKLVADEVAEQVSDYVKTDVPVGPYLADQILLPLGIRARRRDLPARRRGGAFRTLPLTLHSTTHIESLRRFLDIDIRTEQVDKTCLVTLRPNDSK
jgi:RNA 3'-terminal phosphate cyclase